MRRSRTLVATLAALVLLVAFARIARDAYTPRAVTPAPKRIAAVVASGAAKGTPAVVNPVRRTSSPISLPVTPGITIAPAPVPAEAAALVTAARDDLASWLGVPTDRVFATSVTAVTWPDPSLGCPEPGKAYPQSLVPGWIITVSDGRAANSYNADLDSRLVTCDSPSIRMPPVMTRLPDQTPTPIPTAASRESTVVSARTDLARRLRVSPSQVSVVDVEPTALPNGSVGCEPPGPHGVEMVEWGNLILLGYGDQVYEYRADVRGNIATCNPPRPLSEVQARKATPTPPPDRYVETAVDSLSFDLQLNPREIAVVAVEPGRWPDFSLGCPEPNRSYPQVEVAGYAIRLSARGQTFELHANPLTDALVNCSRDLLPTPTPLGGTVYPIPATPTYSAPSSPLEGIRRRLADSRDVPIDQVVIERIEPASTSKRLDECREAMLNGPSGGEIVELSVPGGYVAAYYLAPDGSYNSCGKD